jgi:anti-sigma regulatory factor (Ser/Thr protein kinase)
VRTHLVHFVPPSAEAVFEVRAAVTRFLDLDLSAEVRGAVLLALDEIITNAVAHSETDGSIIVHVARDGDRVVATVRDNGTGFDLRCIRHDCPPGPLAEGGRGLYLAIQLMDSVTVYSDRGTIVHMTRGGRERARLSAPLRTYESERLIHFAHSLTATPAA